MSGYGGREIELVALPERRCGQSGTCTRACAPACEAPPAPPGGAGTFRPTGPPPRADPARHDLLGGVASDLVDLFAGLLQRRGASMPITLRGRPPALDCYRRTCKPLKPFSAEKITGPPCDRDRNVKPPPNRLVVTQWTTRLLGAQFGWRSPDAGTLIEPILLRSSGTKHFLAHQYRRALCSFHAGEIASLDYSPSAKLLGNTAENDYIVS